MGDFISSGDRGSLRSGLGSYVGNGYRGSNNASARMGQAAASASRAYDVLDGLANGTVTPEQLGFDPASLAGASSETIVDALVDAICAGDTTLDDNAGRDAVNEALSEILDENPGLDPLAMPPAVTEDVWLRTLAYHVFDNLMLDLGGGLQAAARGDAVLFNDRCFEIRGFVLESYREQMAALAATGRRLTTRDNVALARRLNDQVFEVYGTWLQ